MLRRYAFFCLLLVVLPAAVFAQTLASFAQQGLKLVGTGAVANFATQGYAVALSADGTTLAVGGPNDDAGLGATWVFTRSGTGWIQQGPKLIGTGSFGTATQGSSVALSADGNTLAMGGATDNNGTGAAWVFARNGSNWGQQGSKLVGTGFVATFAGQGISVALSADGTTLAVGGANDNNNTGAAWVFARSGTSWGQQGAKLVGTGSVGTATQGRSVALSADGITLAVGGANDNSRSGAAWIFSTTSSPLAQRATAGPHAGASFFPNPVAERFTVTGGARAGTLGLFDTVGRNVLTGTYHEGQSVDLSALPPGLYWLQLDRQSPQPLLKR